MRPAVTPTPARHERLTLGRRTCEVILDPHNRRVKVLDVDADFFAALEEFFAGLARSSPPDRFTKLTAYAIGTDAATWRAHGLRHEAEIRGFYPEGASAHLWTRYTDGARSRDAAHAEQDRIVREATARGTGLQPRPDGLRLRTAGADDAPRVAAFLRATFADYPSALDDAKVRRAILAGDARFHVLEGARGDLAAVASAEIDRRRGNAEITDCATDPAWRGRGLMAGLIHSFDAALAREEGIRDLYTLARADIVGMNRAFAAAGYDYTGRLVKNCRMPGGFESMNVWCRRSEAS